ncbi:class I SAM-dependent methyltransferase [Streptomyces sp. SID3343]|uniref:methyltransferase domain-containing protein n=1 Tax=Streptomyces sp. SID3343 TaxID=2690260 RepID=UPI00136F252C|nr:methyltransferase domain-containing protein [Streptomyces sp. SID3343]
MTDWNQLLTDEQFIARHPEGNFYRFLGKVEDLHSVRPLRAWDLCCGAGRHTVAMAHRGWEVYASDGAETGIEETVRWSTSEGLEKRVRTAVADMVECPWPNIDFHAVVSWDAIHHNTVDKTRRTVENVLAHLVPGGLFLGSVAGDKAWKNGHGEEIEPGTFIADVGADIGATHHFYTLAEVEALLEGFEIAVVGEYMRYAKDDRQLNPFGSTTWRFVARRPV